VKLLVQERETQALAGFLAARPAWVSSSLAKAELLRAARRAGASLVGARDLVDRVALAPVDDDVLECSATSSSTRASLLQPMSLRTLDAIHAATCARLRDRLSGVVTYDARMAEALRDLGLRVVAPA